MTITKVITAPQPLPATLAEHSPDVERGTDDSAGHRQLVLDKVLRRRRGLDPRQLRPHRSGQGRHRHNIGWHLAELERRAPSVVGSGIDVIDEACARVWGAVQLSPTAIMVNSQQGADFSSSSWGPARPSPSCRPPTPTPGPTWPVAGSWAGISTGLPAVCRSRWRSTPTCPRARSSCGPTGCPPGLEHRERLRGPVPVRHHALRLRLELDTHNRRRWAPVRLEIRSNETLVNRAPLAQVVVSGVQALAVP